MNLLHFISDYVSDPDFREEFRTLPFTRDRVAILRERYGMHDRQIGIVLREDREDAIAEVAREIRATDFENLPLSIQPEPPLPPTPPAGVVDDEPAPPPWQPPPGGVVDDEDIGSETVFWPGPLSVSVEMMAPDEAPAGRTVTAILLGWHFAKDAEVVLLRGTQTFPAEVVRVRTDRATGRSWAQVRVSVPEAGAYSVNVRQGVSPAAEVASMLPDGFRAT